MLLNSKCCPLWWGWLSLCGKRRISCSRKWAAASETFPLPPMRGQERVLDQPQHPPQHPVRQVILQNIYLNNLDSHLKLLEGQGRRRMYRTKEARAYQIPKAKGAKLNADCSRRGVSHLSWISLPPREPPDQIGGQGAEWIQNPWGSETTGSRAVWFVGILTRSNLFPSDSCERSVCPMNSRWEKCIKVAWWHRDTW